MNVYVPLYGRGVRSAHVPLHIPDESAPGYALCGRQAEPPDRFEICAYNADLRAQRPAILAKSICGYCRHRLDVLEGRCKTQAQVAQEARVARWQAKIDAWNASCALTMTQGFWRGNATQPTEAA